MRVKVGVEGDYGCHILVRCTTYSDLFQPKTLPAGKGMGVPVVRRNRISHRHRTTSGFLTLRPGRGDAIVFCLTDAEGVSIVGDGSSATGFGGRCRCTRSYAAV